MTVCVRYTCGADFMVFGRFLLKSSETAPQVSRRILLPPAEARLRAVTYESASVFRFFHRESRSHFALLFVLRRSREIIESSEHL
jgi:hypothetical protein